MRVEHITPFSLKMLLLDLSNTFGIIYCSEPPSNLLFASLPKFIPIFRPRDCNSVNYAWWLELIKDILIMPVSQFLWHFCCSGVPIFYWQCQSRWIISENHCEWVNPYDRAYTFLRKTHQVFGLLYVIFFPDTLLYAE